MGVHGNGETRMAEERSSKGRDCGGYLGKGISSPATWSKERRKLPQWEPE